jgi:glycerol-3-phosphate dehydrogenase
LGKSQQIRLDSNNPLHARFTDAFTYYDCWVDDARLVVLNALDARDHGAEILTRTKFMSAQNKGDHWQAELSGQRKITARVIVNAAGPWVSDIINDGLSLPAHNRLRLVKGSHIIVPKLFEGEDAYILQNKDGRIIFAIPYEQDFTLIGTTDVPFEGDPATVHISADEIDYLCHHINAYFKNNLSADDVVSHYAGVRPLYDDATHEASAVTRDFVLALRQDGGAPLLSVFGGKITTFRHLAEEALERLREFFPNMTSEWTATAPLPGGDISNMKDFIRHKQTKYAWLDKELCARYAHLYGSRMEDMLANESQNAKLIGPGLYDYEADFLIRKEWAITAEDILWRRTKLGLTWSAAEVAQLEIWLTNHI